jgi:hypothetical protein
LSTPDELVYHIEWYGQKGGALASLSQAASLLGREFGWLQGQAVGFILCGHVPRIERMTIAFDDALRIPALARIKMEIDPCMSPREVMDRYATKRREVYGGRDRPLSDQRCFLASYCSLHRSRVEDWSLLMDGWNCFVDECPQYGLSPYDDVARFKLEAREAVDRLLDPKGKHAGKLGYFVAGAVGLEEYATLSMALTGGEMDQVLSRCIETSEVSLTGE